MSHDILIIGGGLAGLTAALDMRRRGLQVGLIEKKSYPFHRVCGEYISNEVLPYLSTLGVDPFAWGARPISRFRLTSPRGKIVNLNLPLGGFGLSRFRFDQQLYEYGLDAGVAFFLGKTVRAVQWKGGHHVLSCADGSTYAAPLVLAAYGKRAALDRTLSRPFFTQRSPYIGVKFHAELDIPPDQVSLHNFRSGYCGVSQVEEGIVNICYLADRAQLRKQGSLEALHQNCLSQNPHLAEVLTTARPHWENPLVINEISFAPKAPIEQHMLMIGDAAGLITPLCGNGMAMAILGARAAAELGTAFLQKNMSRSQLEAAYRRRWRGQFGARLWVGRNIQALFRHQRLAEWSVGAMSGLPGLARQVIRLTHG